MRACVDTRWPGWLIDTEVALGGLEDGIPGDGIDDGSPHRISDFHRANIVVRARFNAGGTTDTGGFLDDDIATG